MEKLATYAHGATLKPNSGFFAKLTTRFSEMREERRAINELRQLSDRELNDLGISRYDIVNVVKGAR